MSLFEKIAEVVQDGKKTAVVYGLITLTAVGSFFAASARAKQNHLSKIRSGAYQAHVEGGNYNLDICVDTITHPKFEIWCYDEEIIRFEEVKVRNTPNATIVDVVEAKNDQKGKRTWYIDQNNDSQLDRIVVDNEEIPLEPVKTLTQDQFTFYMVNSNEASLIATDHQIKKERQEKEKERFARQVKKLGKLEGTIRRRTSKKNNTYWEFTGTLGNEEIDCLLRGGKLYRIRVEKPNESVIMKDLTTYPAPLEIVAIKESGESEYQEFSYHRREHERTIVEKLTPTFQAYKTAVEQQIPVFIEAYQDQLIEGITLETEET